MVQTCGGESITHLYGTPLHKDWFHSWLFYSSIDILILASLHLENCTRVNGSAFTDISIGNISIAVISRAATWIFQLLMVDIIPVRREVPFLTDFGVHPVAATNVRDAPREEPIARAAAGGDLGAIHNGTSWTNHTLVDVEVCPPLPVLNHWWVGCIIDIAVPIIVGNKVQIGAGGIVDEAFCRYSITVPSSVAKS